MFGKEINLTKGNTSIIAKDLFIKGNIDCEGILEIEGRIEGDIHGNIVTLRETSSVVGNIYTKVVNLKGNFNGTVKSERINISGRANIKGTLEYSSLCVEDGAAIDGDLKRVNEVKLPKNDNVKSDSSTSSKDDQKK